jgi:hypothetical protein
MDVPLPNLSQIRNLSKSAIVNSSITHIAASCCHHLLTAQQLRLVKAEGNALRAEVNEWRARAGVPGVEEPRRGEGFAVVLAGELEFEVGCSRSPRTGPGSQPARRCQS